MPRYLLGFAASLFYCVAALAQTGAQTGGVEIKDAWARATPGGAQNGAAYLTLLSPTGDRLTGVTSPAAEKAELHQMTNDGGIMKMREVTAIDLPPGTPVSLKPGGLHVMLMGLKHPLQPGQSRPGDTAIRKIRHARGQCRGRQGRRDGTGDPVRERRTPTPAH